MQAYLALSQPELNFLVQAGSPACIPMAGTVRFVFFRLSIIETSFISCTVKPRSSGRGYMARRLKSALYSQIAMAE